MQAVKAVSLVSHNYRIIGNAYRQPHDPHKRQFNILNANHTDQHPKSTKFFNHSKCELDPSYDCDFGLRPRRHRGVLWLFRPNDHITVRMRIEIDQRPFGLRFSLLFILHSLVLRLSDGFRIEPGVWEDGPLGSVDVRLVGLAHRRGSESADGMNEGGVDGDDRCDAMLRGSLEWICACTLSEWTVDKCLQGVFGKLVNLVALGNEVGC